MSPRRTWTALLASALVVGGTGSAAAAPGAAPTDDVRADAAAVVRATDAPAVVRVGSASTVVRVTVVTAEPMDDLDVFLEAADGSTLTYGYAEGAEAGRPTVLKAGVEVYADEVVGWGRHTWVLSAFRGAGDAEASAEVPTDVRAHSLLGLRTARSGSQVVVRGSARAYHNVLDRYVGWSGRPVSVQRWTGSAWVQVAGVSTDARGDLATSVTVPAGARLRLVTPDAAGTWGAVSATSVG